ncbi:5'-nucleotidase C-terminal domain-containing protein [Indiicoccus explosivorum]|uniref:5'-nucleotidase C-terminal domain-containing protein n=1 Tax=Indiicoccus explosivorum TaxID=1917864 RepID=UPI000B45526E|nr:5'-nucleotidase C-terminal domain-containing protein [Indiicoccus explosivorum]
MANFLANKKFIATAVTAAAVASAVSPVSADTLFTDVSDRYEDAVEFLVGTGITDGMTYTTFGTQEDIKRVDAAVMIARALGLEKSGDYAETAFTDVPDRAEWAVAALAELEIINGYSDTQFGSSDPLTRAQAAAIIARAAGLEIDESITETQFTDVNERWAPYVAALVEAGIAFGKTETQFGAEEDVTRGEMALFLNRAKEYFGYYPLTVMHTNDTHANVEKMPQLISAIEEVREHNENTLLLSAGDVFSGSLYFNEFLGQADLELMNYAGYDAMTFGNHEFDLGSGEEGHQGLVDFITNAEFPFVSANVDFSGDALFDGLQNDVYTSEFIDGEIYDGIITEVGGEEIGIFGLTTAETANISSPGSVAFAEYTAAAEEAVTAFHAAGVDKIIALTHIGFDDSLQYDNDIALAAAVEGIDIIVGGHTHTELEEPYISTEFEDPTVIVQAGQYSDFLGTLDVIFGPEGEVVAYDGELLDIEAFEPDAGALEIVGKYKPTIDELMEAPVGATAEVLLSAARDLVRAQEAPLGNLIADGMLAAAQEVSEVPVVFAVQNGGGIRADIDAGEITYGEVLTVLPFNNSLALMDLTGAEIKQAFEHSVALYPELSGAFLQVSEGVQVVFDSSRPAGDRVVSIEVLQDGEWVAIDMDATYRIATNVFTAKGGDDYDVFAEAYADGRVFEPGNIDWETFADYLASLETVNPQDEDRIVNIAPSAE